MLYFVCFIFGILLFFDYFCNDFIVDLFTENKEIVIIISSSSSSSTRREI